MIARGFVTEMMSSVKAEGGLFEVVMAVKRALSMGRPAEVHRLASKASRCFITYQAMP